MKQTTSNGRSTIQVVCGEVPEISRLELPCFVQSGEKALDCLGGKDTVCEAMKDSESALQFKYPTAEITQTQIAASLVHKNGLLLRIRRKKASAGNVQPSDTTCEIVGKVSRSFNFDNLADYQFLPTLPGPPKSSEVRASLGEEVVVLDTVPHSFSRENVNKGVQRLVLHESIRKPTSGTRQSTAGTAVAHSSKASSSAATPTSKRHAAEDGDAIHEEDEAKNFQEANSRNPDKGLAFFINIDDDVPVGHPRGEYPYENERGIVLVRLLKKLFSIIPILSREQIETYLNLEGRVHLFKSCLPYVAYNLVKGPFRQLWVRYGYDPKTDPSSALYQTIHFRVSPQVVQDVTERIGKKVGSSVSRSKMVDLDALRVSEMPLNSVTYLLLNRPQQDPPIFAYNHVLKMQLVVQIFQLMDPTIVEYLRSTPLVTKFDNQYGWFPKSSIVNLRIMALKALPERIHRFTSLPDAVIWDTALPPVIRTRPPPAPPAAASVSSSSDASAQSPAESAPAVVEEAESSAMEVAEATDVTTSTRAYDSAALTAMFKESNFDIEEDATDLGFDAASTGLFVVCNRTLNTLRTYLQCAEHADIDGVLSDATTSAGEVVRDEVRTQDGIYLGKVLAWHRRYATTLKHLPVVTRESVDPPPAKKQTKQRAPKVAKIPKTSKAASASKAAKVSFHDTPGAGSGVALGLARAIADGMVAGTGPGGFHASAMVGRGVEAFSHFEDDGDDSHSDRDSDSDSGSEEFS